MSDAEKIRHAQPEQFPAAALTVGVTVSEAPTRPVLGISDRASVEAARRMVGGPRLPALRDAA